jgi:hypothetical protein
MTPHKSQVVQEEAPRYVKILKQHCDEKRSQSANKLRRDGERRRTKVPKASGEAMKRDASDARSLKYMDEVSKLQADLDRAFPMHLLYTNRAKYGL